MNKEGKQIWDCSFGHLHLRDSKIYVGKCLRDSGESRFSLHREAPVRSLWEEGIENEQK
jgi:hypothetical protein